MLLAFFFEIRLLWKKPLGRFILQGFVLCFVWCGVAKKRMNMKMETKTKIYKMMKMKMRMKMKMKESEYED